MATFRYGIQSRAPEKPFATARRCRTICLRVLGACLNLQIQGQKPYLSPGDDLISHLLAYTGLSIRWADVFAQEFKNLAYRMRERVRSGPGESKERGATWLLILGARLAQQPRRTCERELSAGDGELDRDPRQRLDPQVDQALKVDDRLLTIISSGL